MHERLLIALVALTACKADDTEEPANRAPSAPEIALGPVGATTGDDLVVEIVTPSTDADGDEVAYAFAWTLDGVVVEDLAADTVPAARTARGEVWGVVVTPNDGEDDGASAEASITIGNSAPALTVRVDPRPLLTDDVAAAIVEPADADADAVSLSYAWLVDGAPAGDDAELLDGATAFDRG